MRQAMTWEVATPGFEERDPGIRRKAMLALAVALPVPLLAAGGLTLPLPGQIYRLAAAAIERTAAIAQALPGIEETRVPAGPPSARERAAVPTRVPVQKATSAALDPSKIRGAGPRARGPETRATVVLTPTVTIPTSRSRLPEQPATVPATGTDRTIEPTDIVTTPAATPASAAGTRTDEARPADAAPTVPPPAPTEPARTKDPAPPTTDPEPTTVSASTTVSSTAVTGPTSSGDRGWISSPPAVTATVSITSEPVSVAVGASTATGSWSGSVTGRRP